MTMSSKAYERFQQGIALKNYMNIICLSPKKK